MLYHDADSISTSLGSRVSASCPRVFAGDTDEFMIFLIKKTVNAAKPATAAARTQIMPMNKGPILSDDVHAGRGIVVGLRDSSHSLNPTERAFPNVNFCLKETSASPDRTRSGNMARKKVAPYRATWVRRAEDSLRDALASPAGVLNSPFKFGAELRVPFDRLREVVAGLARTHRWSMFGPDTPVSQGDLAKALERAGKRSERFVRTRYRGKVKTGTFAIGIDVDDEPGRASESEPADMEADVVEGAGVGGDRVAAEGVGPPLHSKRVRGLGRFATAAKKGPIPVTFVACTCGFETPNADAAKKHAASCDGTATKKRFEMSATPPRVDEGAELVAVEMRAYACANDKCVAHDVEKIWLSRQAAHQHARQRGCLMTSSRRVFYTVR